VLKIATTGSVTVDLNNFGDMINESAELGANVVTGVSDQGDLIGLAIGLSIAIGMLFGVVLLLVGIIITLVQRTKGLKKKV